MESERDSGVGSQFQESLVASESGMQVYYTYCRFRVLFSGVAREFHNLGSQIFQDGGHVDWSELIDA